MVTNTGFMIAADQAGLATTAATSQFWFIGGMLGKSNTETDVQTVIRDAGTFHNMFVRITANAATGTNTVTFRKNTAAGTQTVNPAGTTGNFQDTTHTDAVVAADKVNYNTSADSTLTTTFKLRSILFDSTTNFSTKGVVGIAAAGTGVAVTSASNTNVINGLLAANASNEPGTLTLLKKAGTYAHLQAHTVTDAKTATMTVISRLGTPTIANGALTLTVPASPSGVGIFEDTTHSDTISAANTWNSKFVVGTDTVNAATFTLIAQDFETSTGNFFLVQAAASADVAGTASTTVFAPIGGRLAFTVTETDVQSNALAKFTYSNMTIHQTVASTATGTCKLRKNTANGTQTVTFGTAVGNYEDSTHTDAVITTDNVNFSVLCGITTPGSFSKITVYGTFANVTSFVPTDTTTISEAIAHKNIFKRAFTETKTILESLYAMKPELVFIKDLLAFVKIPSSGGHTSFTLTETKTIAEVLLRKPIPKITTQVTNIVETLLRKPIPKLATQSTSISETQLRKAIPKITTQTTVIAEAIAKLCHFFRVLTETKTITETQLRKPIPKLATQTTSISESKLIKTIRPLSETKTITETLLRKTIPKLVLQTVTISETQLRRMIPKLALQTTTISESKLRKVIPKIVLQTVVISEAVAKLSHFFKTLTETKTITESLLRKVIPKITTEVKTVSENLLHKVIRPLTETKTIADSLLRKAIPKIVLQSTVISESLLRKVKPIIATQTTSISETQLRKVIPKIITEVKTISSSLLRKVNPSIVTQTTVISETIAKLCHFFRVPVESTTITETRLRKPIPKLATQTTVISESRLRKVIPGIVLETITIAESKLRKVIPKIVAETKTISDGIVKLKGRFVAMTETITIAEAQLRKILPKITTQTSAISELLSGHKILKKPLTDTIVIAGSVVRKLTAIRAPSDTTIISSVLSKIAKHFRTMTDTSVITGTIIRLTGKLIMLSDTINTSDSIVRLSHFFRTLTETKTVSESMKRKLTPKITSQTTTISGGVIILGRIVILLQSINISDSVARLAHHFRNITQTITITGILSRGELGRLVTLVETIITDDSITTRLSKIKPFVINEISELTERLVVNTAGPSWRWRFVPWKKSSYDNEFTPERHYPSIKMPFIPTEIQAAVTATFDKIKTRLPFIFPFKEDGDNSNNG